MTALFAHRGHSAEAPENTLAAFKAAVGSGAAGVELDVQLSRDGHPMVIHDEHLERTTNGQGPVGALTRAELERLDAGGWFGPVYRGEPVPALETVLDLLAPTGLLVNVELKTLRVPYPGLVQAVVKLVRARGLEARVILSSFNHHSLVEAARLAPELERGALLYAGLVEPWHYARRAGFGALHVSFPTVDETLAAGCWEAGVRLRAYVVDDPAVARRLRALRVDAIFTNAPRRLAAHLAEG